MTKLILLINMLCVPCISLHVLLRRSSKSQMRLIWAVVEYGVAAAVTFILTTIASRVLSYLFYLSFPETSAKYTCLAAVIAFVWPYVLEFFFRAVHIELKIEQR